MSHRQQNVNKTNNDVDFPSLGVAMNYSDSLFKPQPKHTVVKMVPDGWIQLNKNNDPHIGQISDEYCIFNEWLEQLEVNKRWNICQNIIDRHEEYREIELLHNGPVYLQSWELTQLIKEEEKEQRRQFNEGLDNSDESSDDDFIDYYD